MYLKFPKQKFDEGVKCLSDSVPRRVYPTCATAALIVRSLRVYSVKSVFPKRRTTSLSYITCKRWVIVMTAMPRVKDVFFHFIF